MGWIKTAKEKGREHIILGLFGLIVLLLLVIWRAVPASAWDTVSEATPKRVLWALLGLAVIAIGVETALFLDYRRGSKHTPVPYKPRRLCGVLWDEDSSPLCTVCQTLLHLFYIVSGEDRDQALRCPKCKAEYTLRDDEGYEHALADVKAYLNSTNPNEFD